MEDDNESISSQLSRATSEKNVFHCIKRLIESNGVVGLFDEVLKSPTAFEFVQKYLANRGGEYSEASWILFLCSFGAASDLPSLISAGIISVDSVTPGLIRKLQTATILEYCLARQVVDLSDLQLALSVDNDKVPLELIEEILVELIFDGTLDGKIDEQQHQFYVSWVRSWCRK